MPFQSLTYTCIKTNIAIFTITPKKKHTHTHTRTLYSPWNFLGKNTGVGGLSLLQRIFLTQELNRCVLHCRWILYQLSYQGSSYIRMCVGVYIYTHTCILLLLFSCQVVSYSLWLHGLQPARLLCPWDSPNKNAGWVAISFSIYMFFSE